LSKLMKKLNTDSIEQALFESLTEYTVNRGEDISVNGTFVFQPAFPCFQGHFPDQAILPGIIQMATVRSLVIKALKRQLVPTAAGRIKFRGFIQPREQVLIDVNLKKSQMIWRAVFKISRGNETVSTGRIDFSENTESSAKD
jgi:3-hydroxymyristoyl/3-hydroxydecanoyl-(acyl carrier protein) dehydratase